MNQNVMKKKAKLTKWAFIATEEEIDARLKERLTTEEFAIVSSPVGSGGKKMFKKVIELLVKAGVMELYE